MLWINGSLIWYNDCYNWLICYDYSLSDLNILLTICILYLLLVTFWSRNETFRIISKIHLKVKVVSHSLFLIFFSILLVLFYNMLSIWCSNQLSTSGGNFSLKTIFYVSLSRLFLILCSFTILFYVVILNMSNLICGPLLLQGRITYIKY